jgi:hypothetical protein
MCTGSQSPSRESLCWQEFKHKALTPKAFSPRVLFPLQELQDRLDDEVVERLIPLLAKLINRSIGFWSIFV